MPGSFFNKDSGKGSVTLLQRDSSFGVFFLNSGKFLKTVNCYCNIFCDSLFVKFQVFTV